MNKKPKITFMPGCFDNFEGTQEELDKLVEQIIEMAESGELFENGEPIEFIDEDENEDNDKPTYLH